MLVADLKSELAHFNNDLFSVVRKPSGDNTGVAGCVHIHYADTATVLLRK